MYTGPYNLKLLNRAQKKLSEIGAWENTKKANVDAELKRMVVRSFFFLFLTSLCFLCACSFADHYMVGNCLWKRKHPYFSYLTHF